jgi:gamma-glutamylaminecyclotransferase
MSKTVLFFYGTLKTGGRANHLLAGAEFLRPAWTLPLYRLYGLGPFPGLVVDRAKGMAIHGELWAVDDALLSRLDRYEGVPGLFTREAIGVLGRVGDV